MKYPVQQQALVEKRHGGMSGNLAEIQCINSQDLFQNGREIHISHGERIYTLRLTQLNKMILTA